MSALCPRGMHRWLFSAEQSRAEAKMYSQRYIVATSAPVAHSLQDELLSADPSTSSHAL